MVASRYNPTAIMGRRSAKRTLDRLGGLGVTFVLGDGAFDKDKKAKGVKRETYAGTNRPGSFGISS